MPIRLLYITNDPIIGAIAERAGVDWIFVDMEYRGKKVRQANRDTVISAHTLQDVLTMRSAIRCSQLMVRVNPIGDWSEDEIDDVVEAGADIVMLPFFKSVEEVVAFINFVGGKAKTCLLLETLEAIDVLDEILNVPGIDYVHIGLNDIHIARGTAFMFEFLSDGGVDWIAKKLRHAGIPFGFGGIARIGELVPPAEHILAEHFRVGSSGVILSRSFCHPSQVTADTTFEAMFVSQVAKIREQERLLAKKKSKFFEMNRLRVFKEVTGVAAKIKGKQH